MLKVHFFKEIHKTLVEAKLSVQKRGNFVNQMRSPLPQKIRIFDQKDLEKLNQKIFYVKVEQTIKI